MRKAKKYRTIRSEIWLEALLLLEILEDLHRGVALPHRVLTRVRRPHEFRRLSERLVPQRHGRVDDVFTVAADHQESPVRIVLYSLRIYLAGTHVLDRQWQTFPVLSLLTQCLQVHLLDLAVSRPYDLAAQRVHRHGRLLPADFDHDTTLVVTDGDIVRASHARNSPHSLEAIVQR